MTETYFEKHQSPLTNAHDQPTKQPYPLLRAQTPEFSQLKEGKFNPWILWVTVRRCWTWALPVGTLLAGIAAILVIETFVPEYKAEHWLEAKQDYLVFKGVMPVAKNLSQTEKPIILNPIVLDPVLSDPAIRKAPSSWIRC